MKINKKKLEDIAEALDYMELLEMDDEYINSCFYKTSMKIAAKMRRALRLKGMTQTELSRVMGMDPAVISRYLTGKANMELKTIVKIEEALGINIIDREIAPRIVKEDSTTQSYKQLKVVVDVHYYFPPHIEKPSKPYVDKDKMNAVYKSMVINQHESTLIECDVLNSLA